MSAPEVYDLTASIFLVNAIFNHDHAGNFAGTTIELSTKQETKYKITFLPGGTVMGMHLGKAVPFRNVDYVRTEKNSIRPQHATDQYIHFSAAEKPRIHIYPQLVVAEDDSTVHVITPGLILPEMRLVVDWNALSVA